MWHNRNALLGLVLIWLLPFNVIFAQDTTYASGQGLMTHYATAWVMISPEQLDSLQTMDFDVFQIDTLPDLPAFINLGTISMGTIPVRDTLGNLVGFKGLIFVCDTTQGVCGDFVGSTPGMVDISDLSLMVDFLFLGGDSLRCNPR